MKKAILLFVISILFFCCTKESGPTAKNEACSDFILTDSTNDQYGSKHQESYVYNSDNKLVKHVVYQGNISDNFVAWSDSFSYSNGNMVKSWMSLGDNNSSKPYTTSEYTYSQSTLTGSKYYLGNTLIVHHDYQTDNLGRFSSVTQYDDNSSYQFTPTTTYYLHYDANSNLQNVTGADGLPVYSYLNYDQEPNLWYKIPFDFAYNIFDYFSRYLSPNNFQTTYTYLPPYENYGVLVPRDSLSTNYIYSYSSSNKPLKYIYTPSNGRVSNGPGMSHTVTIRYKCN